MTLLHYTDLRIPSTKKWVDTGHRTLLPFAMVCGMMKHIHRWIYVIEDMFTCTVDPIAEIWPNKLIDVVISWAGFHFNGIRLEIAAVIVPVTTDTSGDHSILDLRVLTI